MSAGKDLVIRLSQLVSDLIHSMESSYYEFNIQFLVQKEYLHKIIMAIVAPVSLKVHHNIASVPYFTINTNFNKQSSSSLEEMYQGNRLTVMKSEKKLQIPQKQKIAQCQINQIHAQNMVDKDMKNMPEQQEAEQMPEHAQEMFKKQEKEVFEKLSEDSREMEKEDDKQLPANEQNLQQEGLYKYKQDSAVSGSYCNKNMKYGIHPTAISLSKQLESDLCRWIRKKCIEGNPVSRLLVRKKARKLLDSKYFQATEGWLRKFLIRNPDARQYLMRKCHGKPGNKVASGQMIDREAEDSQSSRGWMEIEDNQISRQQFMKIARQQNMNLSFEDFNILFQNLDPRGTGFIPVEAIEKIKSMNNSE